MIASLTSGGMGLLLGFLLGFGASILVFAFGQNQIDQRDRIIAKTSRCPTCGRRP